MSRKLKLVVALVALALVYKVAVADR